MVASEKDWFEDETFWDRMSPVIFPEAGFTAAAENVPKIITLGGVSRGALLDLACGPGRYAIPFAQAGFQVTAVDRTRCLLERARQRAQTAGAVIEWVEQDMRAFVRPGAFDLAINVFTSFGYFESPAENRRVLENLFGSLKPGGVFVFDHIGKEVLAKKFLPTRSAPLPNDAMLFHRTTIIDDWSRIEDEWLLIEGDTVSRYPLRHWLYSGTEIRALLERVGFVDVALYGGFDATPYDHQAERLVAVARKPG